MACDKLDKVWELSKVSCLFIFYLHIETYLVKSGHKKSILFF